MPLDRDRTAERAARHMSSTMSLLTHQLGQAMGQHFPSDYSNHIAARSEAVAQAIAANDEQALEDFLPGFRSLIYACEMAVRWWEEDAPEELRALADAADERSTSKLRGQPHTHGVDDDVRHLRVVRADDRH